MTLICIKCNSISLSLSNTVLIYDQHCQHVWTNISEEAKITITEEEEQPMIKFVIQENHEKPILFSEVEINQFFINRDGALCQKNSETDCIIIADEHGIPKSKFIQINKFSYINEILPKVTKIEF